MKFFFFKIFFFLLFLNISNASDNIRFVDINYIVNNSKIGESLNKIITEENNKIMKELNNIKKSLDDKKKKIVAQKNILKKDEFQNLVNNYEKEVNDFNNLRKNKTKEFNDFRVGSKKKILDVINPLLTKFLENNSISILLQKDKILFGNNDLDITNEILLILNDNYKTMKFK